MIAFLAENNEVHLVIESGQLFHNIIASFLKVDFTSSECPDINSFSEVFALERGQRSLLVTHWLSVPGDHSSNPKGDKKFPLSYILHLACTF